MLNPQFTIYNASAGSGKTYMLAKAYLKILLQSSNPFQFKNILAITFTNKAVGEMKDRIITMLKIFSSKTEDEAPHPMLKDISNELSLSYSDIKSKSHIILKNLLHNYGAFEITTIDAFTHRLIRTFAHDLRLPFNFEVELDQNSLLFEAVDKLISKAGLDKALTSTLVKFAIEKTQEDKSWDISYDFNSISGILLKENDLPYLEKLKDKKLEDFILLKKTLAKDLLQLQDHIRSLAADALELIESSGLHHEDFSNKYLPNYFVKIANGSISVTYGAKWQINLIEGNTLYPKRVTEVTASKVTEIQPQLAKAFLTSKTLVYEIKLLKSILNNLTPLSVINLIGNELNNLKTDKNIMLISEFNTIISNEIRNQPTPFIYERLGERFNYYFIDEFQDTSKLQWENLIPLLDNSISSGVGSSMIVGDAKQSIYRWRGSDPEQFISLYKKKTIPFQSGTTTLNLDTNYRSSKNIVDFNNSFFTHLGESFLNHDDHILLYNAAKQNIYTTSSGYVNLSFLDIQKTDNRDEKYVSQVLETINSCVKRGFDFKDICVITRKRNEGVAIAQHLSENKIPITSSETLLLKNSPKVRFLLALLRLLTQPSNQALRIEVLEFLAIQNEIEDKHAFYQLHLQKAINDFLNSISASPSNDTISSLSSLPLYGLVEKLIVLHQLNTQPDAYLHYFLDEVFEFVQNTSSNIIGFIRYFESQQDKLSIVVSEDINAVKIMTIHKSKGLEFPVVIFPFADMDIYRELSPKIWFPVDKSHYNGFENVLINFNKDVEHYGKIGPHIYSEHRQNVALDNINLLYVVMTRPVSELHIISKIDFKANGECNTNSFAGLFLSYLVHKGLWSKNELNYTKGSPVLHKTKPSRVHSEQLHLISNQKDANNINIVTKASLLWNPSKLEPIERGNLVHLILSKITSASDLDFALNEVAASGSFNTNNIDKIKPLVKQVLYHPKLETYFNNDDKVYNEQDILLLTGLSVRPDRININYKKEATIIDYKTGVKKASHNKQLISYGHAISQLGFSLKKMLIVYLNETIEIIEV